MRSNRALKIGPGGVLSCVTYGTTIWISGLLSEPKKGMGGAAVVPTAAPPTSDRVKFLLRKDARQPDTTSRPITTFYSSHLMHLPLFSLTLREIGDLAMRSYTPPRKSSGRDLPWSMPRLLRMKPSVVGIKKKVLCPIKADVSSIFSPDSLCTHAKQHSTTTW